jgi:hypothetical protein
MQVVTRYNVSADDGNVTEEAKKQISSVIQVQDSGKSDP